MRTCKFLKVIFICLKFICFGASDLDIIYNLISHIHCGTQCPLLPAPQDSGVSAPEATLDPGHSIQLHSAVINQSKLDLRLINYLAQDWSSEYRLDCLFHAFLYILISPLFVVSVLRAHLRYYASNSQEGKRYGPRFYCTFLRCHAVSTATRKKSPSSCSSLYERMTMNVMTWQTLKSPSWTLRCTLNMTWDRWWLRFTLRTGW